MTLTVDSSSTSEPIITMTRMLDAPRELVWEAFTHPEHVAQWFGGDGFSNPVCQMDLRPGGLWHHVMRAPNGSEFTLDSIFLEVVPPERLVWKNAVDSAPFGGPPNVVQTVTLEELGSRTRWTLVARYASFDDRARSIGMGFAQMVGQGVERLAAFLAGSAAGSATGSRP
jgi:uncharacterized protein YndB with AHSA1/START domain